MIERGSIVQTKPDYQWPCALVIVTGEKTWGITGYMAEFQNDGRAHVRLRHEEYVETGGKIQFPDGE